MPTLDIQQLLCFSKDKKLHPQFEEIQSQSNAYLREIRCYVNNVEHDKIKAKILKRLKYVEEVPSSTDLDALLERLKFYTEKVTQRPNDVFEITKKVFDHFDNFKGASSSTSNGQSSNGQNQTNGSTASNQIQEQPRELSNEEAYKAQKRKAHIKKLTRAAKQCAKAIKKLEEEEMSLEDLDDEDSNYIKIDRYKKRLIKIEKEIAKLREERLYFGLQRDKKFTTEASRIPEVNQQIQKLINESRKFPDYHDILGIYKTVSKEKNLQYSTSNLSDMAKDTFHTVGRQLKNRRLMDDNNVLEAYLPEDQEHEAESPELKACLDQNNQVAVKNFNKVFDEFAEKQIQLKEEPKEVTNETPDNSDNEDNENDDQELNEDELEGLSDGQESEHETNDQSAENTEGSDTETSQGSI